MKLSHNTVFFYLLTIVNGLIPLVTISFISRAVTSEQLGIYLLSFTIMNVLGLIIDFGFTISGVRFLKTINKKIPETIFVSTTFFIKFFIFCVVFILYFVFYISHSHGEVIFFLITIIGALFTGLDSIWILQANNRLIQIVKNNLYSNLIYVISVLSVVIFYKNIYYILWMFVIYKFYIFLISFREVRAIYAITYKGIHKEEVITVLKSTYGVAIFRIFALSYTSANGILLNYLTNKYQVALFLAFEKINKAILFIATPISQALLPYFSEKSNKKKLTLYILFIICFCSLGLIVGNIFARDVIGVFMGRSYLSQNTGELFFFMTIITPFILVSNAIGMLYIIPQKLDKALNIIVISTSVINTLLVFNFVNSSSDGALQMAKVIALSEFFVMSLMIIVMFIHGRKRGK
ncbi:TPA: oligosaccharide flippase family protein [Salmonella enterica]|nr:oligosaccharide flippase family protein [Salmonella enterica]HCL5356802.1 oligosaccharide flippase family protein [Salmonella enterica]